MDRIAVRTMLTGTLLFIVFAQGCDRKGSRQQDPVQWSPLSLSALKNMSYEGFDGIEGPIVLKDGAWEGEPYDSALAARPRILLARDFMLSGDLDGTSGDEAVAFLALSTGGSGTLTYICVVGKGKDEPVNLATSLIGDRIQVLNARIIDRTILLDVVEAGPADAACCPGQLASYGWTLDERGTLEGRALSESPGRLSLATIENQEWVLRWWSVTEPAPVGPAVTLSYDGGKFSGIGGCNRYFATVSEGSSPGAISVGPVGSTRMACSEKQMRLEGRFLANLGRVTTFGFMLGQLALTFEGEEGIQTMLFEKR